MDNKKSIENGNSSQTQIVQQVTNSVVNATFNYFGGMKLSLMKDAITPVVKQSIQTFQKYAKPTDLNKTTVTNTSDKPIMVYSYDMSDMFNLVSHNKMLLAPGKSGEFFTRDSQANVYIQGSYFPLDIQKNYSYNNSNITLDD